MKKIIMVLLLACMLVLTSCAKIVGLTDVNEFDKIALDAVKYDIRPISTYEEGHIPNFMGMGDSDSSEIIMDLYEKSQTIVVIGDDEDVLELFAKLKKAGYKKLYYFVGGYEAYMNAKGESFVPETGCGC